MKNIEPTGLHNPKKYKTIVVDPPWTPKQGSTWKTRFTDKGRPQKHYTTLSLDEIKAINLPADKQAHIYIWVINQHIDWGYELAKAWGLQVIQMFTWCKDGLGVGRFQCNSEHILVCRKGTRHGNPFGMSNGTWFKWPRGKHSEKPDNFYKLVELISPEPRLDMFARRKRHNWDVYGNEVEDSINLNVGGNTKIHAHTSL
jgi:N6-adenosine-specific RNA methylase IME4